MKNRGLLILLSIFLVSWQRKLILPELTGEFIAFGDFRGSVHPCGCDPSSDLGGLKRLAYSFKEIIGDNPKTRPAVFHLGNALAPEEKPDEDFMLSFLASLPVDASLFGPTEAAFLARRKDEALPPALFYLLSNLQDKGNPLFKRGVNPYVDLKDRLVLGFVSLQELPGHSLLNAQEFLDQLRGTPRVKARVLLFRGNDDDEKALRRSGLFDLILEGSRWPLSVPSDPRERRDESLLFNREVGSLRVPVGAQGLLLSEGLAKQFNFDLEESLRCRKGLMPAPGKSLLLSLGDCKSPDVISRFLWLDRQWESKQPDSAIEKKIASYFADQESRFAKRVESRKSALSDSKFLGAAACQGCHPSAYQAWSKSSHATAYNTLKVAGMDKNPECVSCHVLGAEAPGGFVSQELSPQFMHVQCENCHGPRKDHVIDQKAVASSDPKAACVGCHVGNHSPNFAYPEYWKKIYHGNELR